MDHFSKWMEDQGETDESVARKLQIAGVALSRVQVLRIRTGQSGASKATAKALEQITGIAWHEFIGPVSKPEQTQAIAS